jgi:hypothetical protein
MIAETRFRRLDCNGAGEGWSDWRARSTESLATTDRGEEPESSSRIGTLMYALLQRIFEAISKVTLAVQ